VGAGVGWGGKEGGCGELLRSCMYDERDILDYW